MNDPQLNYDADSKQMQNNAYRFIFCSYCGQRLESDVKFCSECGMPTKVNQFNSDAERKQEYAGKIIKCPNCGEILNSFVTTCPACGYELRGANNSNAVREFALKLEQIEWNRNISNRSVSGFKGKINTFASINPTDEQKISLIRSFAIPNTKEDIYEFMILASSNIDLKLYGMAYDSTQYLGMMAASQKAVSDAWVAKFEQAYQKANLMFGDSQDFYNVQNLYQKKMKEISRKKMQFPLLIGGLVLLLVLSFILV